MRMCVAPAGSQASAAHTALPDSWGHRERGFWFCPRRRWLHSVSRGMSAGDGDHLGLVPIYGPWS